MVTDRRAADSRLRRDRRSDVVEVFRRRLSIRGFNAVSHRDLADEIGVKSASIHYYFPTKEALGVAALASYHDEIRTFLESLAPLPPHARLRSFAQRFVTAAKEGDQWCLAGTLASDYETLGPDLQSNVGDFFRDIEGWLASQVLLASPGISEEEALKRGRTGIDLLEGALLLARSQSDPDRVSAAAEAFLQLLTR